jgi:diguanylate cyclase (GGDEF)-like protein/PAS domain S-box-containing protein
MPDAIAVVSGDGNIARVNAEFASMFGYAEAELVGAALETIVSAERRSGQETPSADAWQGATGRKKSGSEFAADLMFAPATLNGDGHRIAIVRKAASTPAQADNQQWLLQTALENMTQGFLMFDGTGRISVCNRRYIEMYGLSPEVVKPGCTLRELISHRKATGLFTGDVEQYCVELETALAGGETVRWVVETADGRSMNIVNRPIAGGGWVVTHEDITDRVRAEKHMAHMALHDSLTDLPNRALFRQRLDRALATVRRSGALAVLFLDLDYFKTINDTLGHLVGDELLMQVAQRLKRCVRETDTLARLGGDEFAVVQTGVKHPEDAAQLAERIRDAMRRPFDLDGRRIPVDFSIGVAVAPEDGDDSDQLLKHADMALYAAKAAGRGRFQFFEPGMDAKAKIQHRLELQLRDAVRHRNLKSFTTPS